MEELYRQMYLKYAPNLGDDELNQKVSYAMTQDTDTFVNAFYNKYTGVNPTLQQSDYIKQQDPGFFSQAGTSGAIGLRQFIMEPVAAISEQVTGGFKNLADQWKKTQADGFQMEDLAAWNWEELSTEQQVANMQDQQINGVNLGFGRMKSSKMIQDEVKGLMATQVQYDGSITDDFASGNIGQGIERAVLGGLQSWPTYLAMAHPGALAVLGGLHAGKKFNDEFNKNPEEQTGLLLLNAAGTGLIEFGGDYLVRRAVISPGFRQFMGGSRNTAAIDAVKEIGLGVSGRILKAMGMEGATEMSQAFAVDIWDSVDKLYGTDIRVGLGNDKEYKRLFGENGGINPFNGSRKKWHELFSRQYFLVH